ncbi:hypothetical protein [Actinomadura madurae]|nr:hypothetical protein [Actinomadura madurae]
MKVAEYLTVDGHDAVAVGAGVRLHHAQPSTIASGKAEVRVA